MNLVQRVQDILLRPRETWPQIDAESTDTAAIYKGYLMILAAIGPVCSFIGLSVLGLGFGFRMPLLAGLSMAVVHYVLTLVMIYVMALIVDALAPSFGGQRSTLQALKVVAYGSTASLVGGVFGLFPALWILGLLASLYSLYLFFLGLPVLMKCPPDKAAVYTAAVAVVGLVASLIVGAIASLGAPGMRAWH